MNIGTAKPDKEEMSGILHHLINVTTIDAPWSLAIYKRRALEIIRTIHAKKKIPLLVGCLEYRVDLCGNKSDWLCADDCLRRLIFTGRISS